MLFILAVAGCGHIQFSDPQPVHGSGTSIQVRVDHGVLVEPDGNGLLRRSVTEPMDATLFEDGRLMGAFPDGQRFFARLIGGRPHLWVRGTPDLYAVSGAQVGRSFQGTRVDVISVQDRLVEVSTSFGDATVRFERGDLGAEHPERFHPPRVGIHGALVAQRRVELLDSRGDRVAWTTCGALRQARDGTLLQLRDGIEIVGKPGAEGDPCPSTDPDPVLDLPADWRVPQGTIGDRIAFLADLTETGTVLYSAEGGACLRWEVDDDGSLARHWESETHGYTESIRFRNANADVHLSDRWTDKRAKHLDPHLGRIQVGRPMMLCGPPPAALVAWDAGRVGFARVFDQGDGLQAWPSAFPIAWLYRTQAACQSEISQDPLMAKARGHGRGCDG